MEPLLSLSFDYMSSADSGKIRKGLRQLEGLLAQLCLSQSGNDNSSPDKRRSNAAPSKENRPKNLSQLKDDPAFREFFKLQEGFEWNVSLRLISCLERLLGKGSNGQNDLLIVSTLDLLHGVLLMHPPSRSLFAREIYMNLLLDLLDPTMCPAIHSTTLLLLVSALLSHPPATRTFEALDGLLTVTCLSKSRSTSHMVKTKCLEFLYFYLMPEMPNAVATNTYSSSRGVWDAGVRNPKKPNMGDSGQGTVRSTEEKQDLLGRYLGNVEDLVADLREGTALGDAP